jgi:hypothetical protein
MPSHFGRGFEAFGRQVPLRGAAPPQILSAAPAPAPPPAPVAAAPASVPARPVLQAGRIQVYKKGDPGAPPCPVCRG